MFADLVTDIAEETRFRLIPEEVSISFIPAFASTVAIGAAVLDAIVPYRFSACWSV